MKHDLKVLRALVTPRNTHQLTARWGLALVKLPAVALSNLLAEHGQARVSHSLSARWDNTSATSLMRYGWNEGCPTCSLGRGLLNGSLYLHHAAGITLIRIGGVESYLRFPRATSDFSDSGISVNSRQVITNQTHITFENSSSCRKLAKPDLDCRMPLTCNHVLWIGNFFRRLPG